MMGFQHVDFSEAAFSSLLDAPLRFDNTRLSCFAWRQKRRDSQPPCLERALRTWARRPGKAWWFPALIHY